VPGDEPSVKPTPRPKAPRKPKSPAKPKEAPTPKPVKERKPARDKGPAAPEGAASTWVTPWKTAPDHGKAVALNEAANAMAQHGRLDDAEAKYREALDVDPHFPIAWNNLGVVEMARGNTTRAVWAYQHAIEDNPGYALAYYNLGVTYDKSRNFDQALRSYQKAFELDPGLRDVKKNPAVVSNRYLQAAMAQSYIDRGGASRLPVQSALPPAPPNVSKPAKPARTP